MKKGNGKRFVAWLLSFCMMLSIVSVALPVTLNAEEAHAVVYGEYDKDGKFVRTDNEVLSYTSAGGNRLSLSKKPNLPRTPMSSPLR